MTRIVKRSQKDHKNCDFCDPFMQIMKNTLKKEIIINKIFCSFDFKSLPGNTKCTIIGTSEYHLI